MILSYRVRFCLFAYITQAFCLFATDVVRDPTLLETRHGLRVSSQDVAPAISTEYDATIVCDPGRAHVVCVRSLFREGKGVTAEGCYVRSYVPLTKIDDAPFLYIDTRVPTLTTFPKFYYHMVGATLGIATQDMMGFHNMNFGEHKQVYIGQCPGISFPSAIFRIKITRTGDAPIRIHSGVVDFTQPGLAAFNGVNPLIVSGGVVTFELCLRNVLNGTETDHAELTRYVPPWAKSEVIEK